MPNYKRQERGFSDLLAGEPTPQPPPRRRVAARAKDVDIEAVASATLDKTAVLRFIRTCGDLNTVREIMKTAAQETARLSSLPPSKLVRKVL